MRLHLMTATSFKVAAFLFVSIMTVGCSQTHKKPPAITSAANSTIFGKNVYVFDATMASDSIRSLLKILNKQQRYNEFGSERYALLFKPGNYDLDLTVDYYMQALGLGRYPEDVRITGAVQSTTSTSNDGIADKVTTMFWRGAENFKVIPRHDKMIYWAVSQAAPYRRMHVAGAINFDLGSWASGGLLANSLVEGRAGLTSGQQWLTRNSKIGSWEGGNWNRVFVGVNGAPEDTWPQQPTTVIDNTPVIREKPFLTYDAASGYAVFVPALQRDTSGPTWLRKDEAGELISLGEFHIAHPETDDARALNQVLKDGKHLLLTPGIYPLDEPLLIQNPNTVILGLGLPTLIPQTGSAAVVTADVPGIKLAGFMVDAGPKLSPSLIEIGPEDSGVNYTDNPISLHDIYCRIGGATVGQAEAAVTINSNYVIGDHFWLWRADHGIGTEWGTGQNKHGLVVNGDHVTLYGLFNEHFQAYQTLWRGEHGRTFFYQSEIPYRPPSNALWNDNGKPGFASYKVSDEVQYHEAYGLGIYSFFSGQPTISNQVRLENAIEVPDHPGILIHHISTFSGRHGGINHIINGLGPATEALELKHFDGFRGKEE